MGTTRIVMITRGERFYGALLGFFEVLLWVVLISTVLTNVTEDPIKVIVYAMGFSTGNYVGSLFEQHLGIGNVRIEVIVMDDHGCSLVDKIRSHGYGVTVLDGKGMNSNRQVLIMNIKRKNYLKVVEMIKEFQGDVVITINDIKPIYGGYGLLKK